MKNEINFTRELLEQAKTAPSAAALSVLAQENGVTLTAKEAATYYARFHPETGPLSDEELNNVSSGGCFFPDDFWDLNDSENAKYQTCACGSNKFKIDVLFNPYCKYCDKKAIPK